MSEPAVLVDKVREDFIRAQTRLAAPPLVPEIALHLASDAIGLWHKTESDFGNGSVPGTVLPPPYWAFAWPGGQALARYLLDNPQTVAGGSVLDFGSGSGLLAIASAMSGAFPVCASELDETALVAIELNARANHVFIEPLSRDLIGESGRWRTVLCGDMCYERPLAGRLTQWLMVLARDGVRVLLGDPGRNYFPRDTDGCTLQRLASYTVPTSRDLEDKEQRETSVYALSVP